MKFDIKDVFTWANAEKVKEFIGKECYFADDFDELDAEIKKNITYNLADVNVSSIWSFKTNIVGSYAICLLADKVIKEEPKYRPFKDLYEFYQFLSFNSRITKEDFTPVMLLGLYFKYREKKALRVASTIVINRIDVDLKDICEPIIEGRNFERWFDLAEIMNDDGEWQPFGVLEK